ncbi:urease accessory protein UreD [Yoonia sediminilitoris]|uniref:Urease accessory protein UreD n=1 Tax=Yoonia sediminilitoris TaxID=1286148 RepID=A0A2T6KPV3_9RHOB|nr:urease accessory protein UreD [Yoonia sediminilitoris]PUB18593.1 urease accessory protein [Yoonia sediminilitoris]RCW98761.1 urease accessory protein [Yoonia sediminilitoris]
MRQSGSLKALFPRVAGKALDAVFLNTAGGLTGGDRMQYALAAGPDAFLSLSSQAAERAYRAQPGQVARSDVTMTVAAGGCIHWLPQETILFEGAALARRLRVDLESDASALIVEPLIFGREAMGEDLHDLSFTDQWRIFRDKKLVFADAVRLMGDAHRMLTHRAVAGGARAMATVLLAGPKAALHADLPLPETAGASLIADDLLLLRFLAKDGFDLRHDIIPVIEALSEVPLPKVWRL